MVIIEIGFLTYYSSIALTFYAVCMSKASEKQHEKYSLVHDNSTLLLLPEMVEGLKIWEGASSDISRGAVIGKTVKALYLH